MNIGDSNYPPGAANDPRAPYNEVEPKIEEAEVTADVSISLTHLNTRFKAEGEVIEESDWDGEGDYYPHKSYDFSNTNLEEAYLSSPISILNLLKDYSNILKGYRKQVKTELDSCTNKQDIKILVKKINCYTHIINECESWIVDDINVIDE